MQTRLRRLDDRVLDENFGARQQPPLTRRQKLVVVAWTLPVLFLYLGLLTADYLLVHNGGTSPGWLRVGARLGPFLAPLTAVLVTQLAIQRMRR